VWVLKIILFDWDYGLFINAVGFFCDDVTQFCGSYRKSVDVL
jgi:hypothetical protein